jgi:uncharacterized repeat protein (TIGR03803 family)
MNWEVMMRNSNIGSFPAMPRTNRAAFFVAPLKGYTLAAITALAMMLASTTAIQAQTLTTLYSFCAVTASLSTPYGNFSYCADGSGPETNLIQASDGNLYGVTPTGGAAIFSGDVLSTFGTVFKISPAGTLSTLYVFCNPAVPNSCAAGGEGVDDSASLVEGSDGNFYGSAFAGGSAGYGAIFKLTPSGSIAGLYSFCAQPGNEDGENCPDGATPYTGLIEDAAGDFYGAAKVPDASSFNDEVFKLSPSGKVTVLSGLCNPADSCTTYPWGDVNAVALNPSAVIQGSDGNFYATSSRGGVGFSNYTSDLGSVVKITPDGEFSLLYSFCSANEYNFPCPDGVYPWGALVEGNDGNFYGTTSGGCSSPDPACTEGYGTVFKLTPTGTLTTIYTFCSQGGAICADGSTPWGSLVLGSDGAFWGTTQYGGAYKSAKIGAAEYGAGTIFRITADGSLTTVYNFCGQGGSACTDGADPQSGLVQSSDGNFYGVTSAGGAHGNGTAFQLAFSPDLPPPVQLSFSPAHPEPGEPVTLSWQVANGASLNMQRCAAFAGQQGQFAGMWSGKQTGAFANGVYSGSATITPSADGTYLYALTCGGVESGFGTLIVTGKPAIAAATPASLAFGEEAIDTTSIARTITLRNTGASALVISGIAASGSFRQTNDCGSGIAKGATCTIAVTFNPTAIGAHDGTLTILDNSDGKTGSRQTIDLTGAGRTGIAQSITLTPPSSPVTYGVKPVALGARSSSGLAVRFAVVSGPASVSGNTLTISAAGTVVIAATQAGNATYAPAREVKATITVKLAPLTVKATDQTISQGSAIPPLTYTMSGFVNGDTQKSATSGMPALFTTATSSSPAGTYPIYAGDGTLKANNYDFVFVSGDLTIQ